MNEGSIKCLRFALSNAIEYGLRMNDPQMPVIERAPLNKV